MLPIQCPQCGSQRTRMARKQERPDVEFIIKAFRKCEACGTIFEPAGCYAAR